MRVWITALGLGLTGGCVLMPRTVEFVRGNVQSLGTQDHLFAAAEYSSLWIGTPLEPYAGRPPVTLRFPDGARVRSDRLDVAWLRAHADRAAPRRAPSLLAEQGWPTDAEELAVGGCRFVVQADKSGWLRIRRPRLAPNACTGDRRHRGPGVPSPPPFGSAR